MLALEAPAGEAPLAGLAGAADAAALGAAAAAGLASPLTDELGAAFAVDAGVEGSDVALLALLVSGLDALLALLLTGLDFEAVPVDDFSESD